MAYHPKYQRYILGVEGSGLSLVRTLGITGIGYMIAHFTEFRRNSTPLPLRVVYLLPIMMAAYGWNLAFENDSVVAQLRNNEKEKAHQAKLGNRID